MQIQQSLSQYAQQHDRMRSDQRTRLRPNTHGNMSSGNGNGTATATATATRRMDRTRHGPGEAHNAKFVSLLVQLLSDGAVDPITPGIPRSDYDDAGLDRTTKIGIHSAAEAKTNVHSKHPKGDDDDDDDDDDGVLEPIERLQGMLDLLTNSNLSTSLSSSMLAPLLGSGSMDLQELNRYLRNMTVEKLCHLPSFLIQMMQREQEHGLTHGNSKRRKIDMTDATRPYHSTSTSSTSTSTLTSTILQRTYAIIGYMTTHILLQENFEMIVHYTEFKQYLQEQMVQSGFVSKRMFLYNVEHDAFFLGFVTYLLDCMNGSTNIWEQDHTGADGDALDGPGNRHGQGFYEWSGMDCAVRNCFVRDDLWMEGLGVRAIVNCLLENR